MQGRRPKCGTGADEMSRLHPLPVRHRHLPPLRLALTDHDPRPALGILVAALPGRGDRGIEGVAVFVFADAAKLIVERPERNFIFIPNEARFDGILPVSAHGIFQRLFIQPMGALDLGQGLARNLPKLARDLLHLPAMHWEHGPAVPPHLLPGPLRTETRRAYFDHRRAVSVHGFLLTPDERPLPLVV